MKYSHLIYDDRRFTKWLPLADLGWCASEVERLAADGVSAITIKTDRVPGNPARCAVARLDRQLLGVR